MSGWSREIPHLQAARQSGRLDLNQRPLGPQPSALPDCATPRKPHASAAESGRPDSNRHRELGRLLCDRYTTPAWSVIVGRALGLVVENGDVNACRPKDESVKLAFRWPA